MLSWCCSRLWRQFPVLPLPFLWRCVQVVYFSRSLVSVRISCRPGFLYTLWPVSGLPASPLGFQTRPGSPSSSGLDCPCWHPGYTTSICWSKRRPLRYVSGRRTWPHTRRHAMLPAADWKWREHLTNSQVSRTWGPSGSAGSSQGTVGFLPQHVDVLM